MIALRNVTHSVGPPSNEFFLLQNQSITFGDRERIGILAPASSGKTSLARLLSGIDVPDAGQIHSNRSVSWPIGIASIIHPELSVQENLFMIAKLTGNSPTKARHNFDKICGLNLQRETKAKNLSPSQRALFGYGLSLMTEQQHYIFDDKFFVGSPEQQARQKSVLDQRLKRSGFILVSRNTRLLKSQCWRFFKLGNGKLLEYSNSEFDHLETSYV